MLYNGSTVTGVTYNGQSVTKVYYNGVLVFDNTPTEAPTEPVTIAPTVAPTSAPTTIVTEAPSSGGSTTKSITGITLTWAAYSSYFQKTTIDVLGTFTGGAPSYWEFHYTKTSNGIKTVKSFAATTGTVSLDLGTYTFYGLYNGTQTSTKTLVVDTSSITVYG
jgi:hypothetical protein